MYGSDVLATGWRDRGAKKVPQVAAEADLVVEVADDGFCGAVTRVQGGNVELEDRLGRRRLFPLGGGSSSTAHLSGWSSRSEGAGTSQDGIRFLRRRRPARPRGPAQSDPRRGQARCRTRREGVGRRPAGRGSGRRVLQGVDLLDDLLAAEPPSATRRYGVLVDHLVAGSKESRIADAVARGPHGRHLRIVGHPFVDVWQCVTPRALGIAKWPEIPRGIEWKVGICRAFGWPHETQADIARAWQHILSKVTTYRDLEPALLGRVEELIDFVTAPAV